MLSYFKDLYRYLQADLPPPESFGSSRALTLLMFDEISRAMSSALSGVQPTLELFCEAVIAILQVERSLLLRYLPDRRRLVVAAARGMVDFPSLEHLELPADQGSIGRCLSTRAPFHIRAAQETAPELRLLLEELELEDFLVAPMLWGSEVRGILIASSRPGAPALQPEHGRLLMVLANLAAVAIENATLIQDLRAHNSRLQAMLEVSTALSATLELEPLLELILQNALQITNADVGAILLSGDQAALSVRCSRGVPETFWRNRRLQPGEGLTGWVLLEDRPIRVADVRTDPRYLEATAATRSELAVPIRLDGRVLGVINVESDRLGAFSQAHEQLLLVLAAHAAVAIRNATRFGALQRSHEDDRTK